MSWSSGAWARVRRLARADPGTDATSDWVQRTDATIRWIGFVLLPVAVVAVLVSTESSGRQLATTLGLAAVAAAWMVLGVTSPPAAWRDHPARVPVYVAGLLGLCAVLMLREPSFFVFTITGFLHAMMLTPTWLAVVAVMITSAMINIIPGGPPDTPGGWIPVAFLVAIQTTAIAGFTYTGTKVAAQSDERRRVVAELESALAENQTLHTQLLTQAREAGAQDERQRMAREIHDTLAQGLIGIITQLEAAEQATDAGERARHLGHAEQLARTGLAEARRSVRALQPSSLDERTLPEALDAVASGWSDVHDVRADVVITGEAVPLHPEVEGTLVRVAQEALANVAKHAGASRVGLTLSYMGDVITLDVRDDGRGFDVGSAPDEPAVDGLRRGGFGLEAMQQRVARVAGTLVVESEPGAGTAISATMPAVPAAVPAAPADERSREPVDA